MKNVSQLLLQQYIIIFSKVTALAIKALLFCQTLKNKSIGQAYIVARSGGISGTGGGKNRSNYPLCTIA